MADHVDPGSSDRVVNEAIRRGRRRRRAWRLATTGTVAAAIIAVVALAALGTFGGGPHPTRVTTSPPTSNAKPSSTSTSTIASASTACQAGQLQVTLTMQSPTMGTALAKVAFENTSSSACRLEGYPKVSMLDAAGHSSEPSTDTTPGSYANPPLGNAPSPVTVQLAPKGQAVVWFTWQDDPVGSQTDASCVKPVRETITPPGSSTAATLSQTLNTLVCAAPQVEPVQAPSFVPSGLTSG